MLLTKFLGMPFVWWAVRKAEKKSGWLDLHSCVWECAKLS